MFGKGKTTQRADGATVTETAKKTKALKAAADLTKKIQQGKQAQARKDGKR